jgi:transglutaminase-like putative cysteine protease
VTRARTSFPQGLGMSALAAATAWAGMLGWRQLTSDAAGGFLVPLLLLGALVALLGAVLRWLRAPLLVVLAAQVALATVWILGTVTGSGAPVPDNFEAFGAAWDAAVDSAQQYVAPVPSTVPPIHPLLLVAGGAAIVVVDLLAVGLHRVPASGLVLLATYSLPVSVVGGGIAWWAFVVPAAGFLVMLFVQHDQQLSRWGRQVDDDDELSDPAGFGVRTGAVRGSALAIGSTATAVAIFVPLVVPTLDLQLLDGPGPGGDGKVQVADPLVDMRRDLSRGQDVPLMWVSTPADRRPEYLRLAVLTRYAGDSWTPGDRDIPDDQIAQGEMPVLQGVSTAVDRKETPYNVRISAELESQWLPTTQHVADINAGSAWRYDRSTMDFLSVSDDLDTAGKAYGFTGISLDVDPEAMDDTISGASAVDPVFTEVPATLPSTIRSLAAGVTGNAPTRFQKAQALQRWFREDGGFEYDLSTVESKGSDYGDLVSFLEEGGRRGYCEQFAASMALMARTLGIPSRVAIGFLRPRAAGPNTWEYSAWDMHAWPELYFHGSGWVRFEPTPPARTGDVPTYTTAELAPERDVPAAPGPTSASDQLPDRGEQPTGADEGTTDDAAGFPWRPVGGGLAGLVAVVALLLVPRAVRGSRRDRRWRSGGIEAVWDELRDVAVDLGHGWPAGRSPREVGRWLAMRFGAPRPRAERAERPRQGRDLAPEAVAALGRLVGDLERSRYARDPVVDEPDGVEARRADAGVVSRALVDGVSPRVERRARWWPRSVVTRERRVAAEKAERPVAGTGSVPSGLVDHVG